MDLITDILLLQEIRGAKYPRAGLARVPCNVLDVYTASRWIGSGSARIDVVAQMVDT